MVRIIQYLPLVMIIGLLGLSGCETRGKPQPPSPIAAAINDDAVQMQLFIVQGLDVDAAYEYGQTLLHLACMEGSIEVARLLIGAGANLEARDQNGETPLFSAAGTGRERLVALLLEAGADPNVVGRYQGSCPLTVALAENHHQIAALLRAAGARECNM